MVGPVYVEETAIIPSLPHGATYHPFEILREGLGKKQHEKAIQETIQETATFLKCCFLLIVVIATIADALDIFASN